MPGDVLCLVGFMEMLLFKGALSISIYSKAKAELSLTSHEWGVNTEAVGRAGRKFLSRHSVRAAIGDHSRHLSGSCSTPVFVIKACAISRVSRGSGHRPVKPDRVGDVPARHRTMVQQLGRARPRTLCFGVMDRTFNVCSQRSANRSGSSQSVYTWLKHDI